MNNLVRFLNKEEDFSNRHIGASEEHISEMLAYLGYTNLDDFIEHAIPPLLFTEETIDIGDPLTETEALEHIKSMARLNQVRKSFIGKGYHASIMPETIKRNVMEQPGWYTSYTPYQPEISQGRLEILFYFQTMICEISGLDIANASLLDEATAATEAVAMAYRISNQEDNDEKKCLFVDKDCHPQNIAVIRTRLSAQNIAIKLASRDEIAQTNDCFAAIVQYPSTDGEVFDLESFVKQCKSKNIITIASIDLMAQMLLRSPGSCGVDIVIGSSQRFGLPLGFGGPHAGFLACIDDYKRLIPGRLVGISKDKHGKPAYRLTMQTREQHIRREKALSNICTAQVLLAILSTIYAIYHSPKGLKLIAMRIHSLANLLAKGLSRASIHPKYNQFFDTLTFERAEAKVIVSRLNQAGYNVYHDTETGGRKITIALDETTTKEDIFTMLHCFSSSHHFSDTLNESFCNDKIIENISIDKRFIREDKFLTQEIFHRYTNETELMRYLKKLKDRDLSLDRTMVPLGSCTMKLNSATSMVPISWECWNNIHPFVPKNQAKGYYTLMGELRSLLLKISSLSEISFQPNSGAQGEYAGLLTIRSYFLSIGQSQRNICLIPMSAHGTNPASATIAGMRVVTVSVTPEGTIDITDLEQKLSEYENEVACIMVTYPSTYGIYNENMTYITKLTHKYGAQVYMDGANMNALVGVSLPGNFGIDVMHFNLHKTFGIPHGGGGPGVGPIAVAEHLAPFLPRHPFNGNEFSIESDENTFNNTVASAPFGSALILTISYMYIRMLGLRGVYKATLVAVLNANYIAKRLSTHYKLLYRGAYDLVAHECIFDPREFKNSAGISAEDIAKRLIDYGFHAPTMSFPVPGTLMVEPTESESKYEIDRFCDAMISIREEIRSIELKKANMENNILVNAPHTLHDITNWQYPYPIKDAILPKKYQGDKYFPPVNRVDNVYGDKNLLCSCPPIESFCENNKINNK